MVNSMNRLFGEPEEPEDPEWLRQFYALKQQLDEIISGVDNAVIRGSSEAQLAAFNKAVEEMPRLLQKLETLPPPKSTLRQRSFGFILHGMSTYLWACQLFKKSLEDNNTDIAWEADRRIKVAGALMAKAWKVATW